MKRARSQLSPGRQWSRLLVWVTFAVVLAVRWTFPPEPEPPSPPVWGPGDRGGWRHHRPPTPVAPPQGAVPTDLWRLHLEIAAADVEKLRGYFWNGRRGQRPEERPEVLARVREGGAVYENVAVHLKGAAGSFRPFDDKPALTLNFSKHAPGQRFHGYSKLSLNNSVQDPTYLCEAISRELFAAAGVPVPRVDHVTVLINGRDLGLYVLAEGWGRPFLRRHFANVDGNLYDGGFLQEITAELDTNSGENRTDHGALERLRVAAFELEAATRAERLAGALDLDRFFRFLAMEIMTCHWDGYAMNRNNYRLFHDRERERMVFLPHGLDQMFGVHRSSPTSPILPAMQGLVANAVLSLPGAPERLREQIAALRAEVFLPERLTNRVQELARRIRPTLAAYAPELAEVHDAHVAALCRRIVARAASISAQLAGEAPVVVEEPGRRRANRWPAGD